MKKCKECNIEKSLSEFYKHPQMKDGHLNTCKICHNKSSKKYSENNTEYLKECKKKYREKNKEKIAEGKRKCFKAKEEQYRAQKAAYYQNNKEYIKAKAAKWRSDNKEYRNSRYANEPLYNLKVKMRSRFSEVFSRMHIPKTGKTRDIIGCGWKDFKDHLENNPYNFKVGGDGLDIDHIIPVSKAQTETELLKLNHYTNLQLLPYKYNRWVKKDSTFDREHFEKYLEKEFGESI